MTIDRQIWAGAIGLAGLVALIARVFIWPGYQEAAAIHRDVALLNAKMNGLDDANQTVRNLDDQLAAMRLAVARRCKSIPASPQIESLIGRLSLPVDGVTMIDQTFDAGSPDEVSLGGSGGLRAMPLKVELSATFESIFALVRAAETMENLVRVSSIKVVCKRDEKAADSMPVLNASLGLEAIYQPDLAEETP